VGGSEKNLARMFRQARSEGAVLVLDEVDGLLFDRRNSQHSWELTQVEELLVQLESFDGLVVCTTNMTDFLDPAAWRRFHFKIRFDFLRSEQLWHLFQQALTVLGSEVTDSKLVTDVRHRLNALTNLTPGDFAAVLGQAPFTQTKWGAEQLLHALECESRGKAERGRMIKGFIN